MYTLLDAVADAEARAVAVALKDRGRYAPFFEAAERFAVKNSLVVGGAAATRLLLGPTPVDLGSYRYEFLSDRASAHARALGDVLYSLDPQGLGHYTTVVAKVAGYHYTVVVDGRDLFTIAALPVHRGVRSADVVIPSARPAQFAADEGRPVQLACLGPEVQLMGVYAALCNPGKAADWVRLLAEEARLRELFGREIRGKIAEAVSRAQAARVGGRSAKRESLSRALCGRYAAGADRVLVGAAALALLTGASLGVARVQVVTVGDLETEAREVAELARAEGFEVQWGVNDPKVPTDPRLRRLTLYLAGGRGGSRGREPFMDIYNAAAYELVPYTSERAPADVRAPALKVATPFAIMRFRLADMWTIQVMMRMNAISPDYGKAVLHEMLADYETAAAYYERVLGAEATAEDAAAKLLPTAAYVGRLEDPDLALKRAASLAAARAQPRGRFVPPYLPAARARPDSPA